MTSSSSVGMTRAWLATLRRDPSARVAAVPGVGRGVLVQAEEAELVQHRVPYADAVLAHAAGEDEGVQAAERARRARATYLASR